MSTTSTSSRWVRLIAVTTIAAAGLLLSGCSLIGQLSHATQRDASGTPTAENDDADVFSIKVGDCLNDATASGTVTTAPIVPCSKPHDSEAYKSILMKDGDFPGEDAVKTQADQGCADAFADLRGDQLRRLQPQDLVLLPDVRQLGERRPRDPLHHLRRRRQDDRHAEGRQALIQLPRKYVQPRTFSAESTQKPRTFGDQLVACVSRNS